MLEHHITTLKPHLNLFTQSKDEVLHHWVDQELITSILKLHDIDCKHFISYYASGVFDYFLSVIKGETQLGSCPVMEEFLAYLKDKNFHANELYTLCTHFKKSMVDTSYDKHINTQEIFAAISFLFDANFSGVLRLYTDTIYQKEQIIAKSLNLLNEYKHAIDTSAIVSKTDVNGVITYASKNFCELSGYTSDELIGKKHSIIRHPDTTEAFYQEMWSSITSNHIFKETMKNSKKDGSDYYVDITILPLTDPMQGIVEYLCIAYDVTTLVEAKEQAYEASKAKENFLSAMSHEIRTPLNAILGFVDILKEDSKEELASHYLNIISHSGTHLLHIINDILDYSKLQNSEITPCYDQFNPHETFSTLIELFKQSAKDKHLNLNATLSASLPQSIQADAMRIQQVISNLLGNAIKFTPEGGDVKLSIDDHDDTLVIRVEDNGIGMSEAVQVDAFRPFIQAKEGQGGTGLGLAITRELINAMQGSITLKSQENRGTCFIVTLPFALSDDQEATIKEPDVHEKQNFNAHILVAEDNEDNQELIGLLLKRFGLTFELVNNGKDAFNRFKESSYDMVILDDEMPHTKGHKVASLMRTFEQEYQHQKTPILLLSAHATEDVKARALEHGCDKFLSKPIQAQELQEVFSHYLNRGFDRQALASELTLDLDELAHLLSIFEKNLPTYMMQLQKALQDEDATLIFKAVHKIKGSASNFNFTTIIEIITRMEQRIQEEELQACHILFEQLQEAFNLLGFKALMPH
jgi:PAS domain S-box-containing protein